MYKGYLFLAILFGVLGAIQLAGFSLVRFAHMQLPDLISDSMERATLFIYAGLIISLVRDNKILREKQ